MLGPHLTQEGLSRIFSRIGNPVSGHLYEPFGLLVLVDMERGDAYEAGGELSTRLLENGFEVPIKVLPASKGPPDDAEALEI